MRSSVIKKVKFDSSEYWVNSGSSYYLVKIDHVNHTIEWESLGGAAPDWDSFLNFCLSDRDMRFELEWAMKEYKRKYPAFIGEREGMSGCWDISLYVSKARHEWAEEIAAKKVLSLHISCAGKMNEGIPDMFVGDLLEIMCYIHKKYELDRKLFKRNLYTYSKLKQNQLIKIKSI